MLIFDRKILEVANQDCYFSESSQQEWNEECGFQFKMLTDQEKLLLITRDEDFLGTFHSWNDGIDNPGEIRPDIPIPEMAESESCAKFALAMSTQRSVTLQRGVDVKEKLKKAGFQFGSRLNSQSRLCHYSLNRKKLPGTSNRS